MNNNNPDYSENSGPSYDQLIGRVAQNNFGNDFREGNVKEEQGYYVGRDLKQEEQFSQRESLDPKQPVSPMHNMPGGGGSMENASPSKGIQMKQSKGATELQDLAMINPLLYKPASKPPVIREGDWLCPDPTVRFFLLIFLVL